MNQLFRLENRANDFHSFWVDPEDEELFDLFGHGIPIGEKWTKPQMTITEEPKKAALPDFPALIDHIPVASDRAWNALQPLIHHAVEALPVLHPGGETYWAFNVVRVLDCLDVGKCRTNRAPEDPDPYFSRIYEYQFFEERIANEPIFRCPEMKRLEVYVSSQFQRIVEEHGFEGFRFVSIYSLP